MTWQVILTFSKQLVSLLSAYAWPISAVWIGYLFREPIQKVLGRMTKFSALGVDVEAPPELAPQPGRAALPSPVMAGQAKLAPFPPDDPIYSPMDRMLLDQLEAEPLTVEGKLAWAARVASANWLNWRHEYHYRYIYGSQIAALNQLNISGPQKRESLRLFFEAAQAQGVPADVFNFDAWLNWLVVSNDVKSEDDGQTFQLTDLGRSFVLWMPQAKASPAKVSNVADTRSATASLKIG